MSKTKERGLAMKYCIAVFLAVIFAFGISVKAIPFDTTVNLITDTPNTTTNFISEGVAIVTSTNQTNFSGTFSFEPIPDTVGFLFAFGNIVSDDGSTSNLISGTQTVGSISYTGKTWDITFATTFPFSSVVSVTYFSTTNEIPYVGKFVDSDTGLTNSGTFQSALNNDNSSTTVMNFTSFDSQNGESIISFRTNATDFPTIGQSGTKIWFAGHENRTVAIGDWFGDFNETAVEVIDGAQLISLKGNAGSRVIIEPMVVQFSGNTIISVGSSGADHLINLGIGTGQGPLLLQSNDIWEVEGLGTSGRQIMSFDAVAAIFLSNNQQNVTLEGIFTRDSTNYALVDVAADGTSSNLSDYNNDAGFITNGVALNATNTFTGPNDFTGGLTVDGVVVDGNKEINITFNDSSNPFFTLTGAVAPTWTPIGSFIFSGTNEWGIPDDFSIVVQGADGDPSLNIRLFDVSNAQVISITNGYVGTTLEAITVGSMSNLPAAMTLFTLQFQRSGSGANNLDVYAAQLRRDK